MIKYSFTGYSGPVTISIYNKLNVPLYVDWKRSALVMNDHSYTYWQNKSTIEGSAESHQIAWTPIVSSTSTTISGIITTDESIGFVAPKAFKQTSMVAINPSFSNLDGPKKDHRVRINTTTGPVNALRYGYDKDNSPIKFRSYLTLSSEASFAHPLTYESEFWITEVVQTGVSPEHYLLEKQNQNKFYVSRLTGFGGVLGVTGLLIMGVLLSAE